MLVHQLVVARWTRLIQVDQLTFVVGIILVGTVADVSAQYHYMDRWARGTVEARWNLFGLWKFLNRLS
jgi:hypothetical protein